MVIKILGILLNRLTLFYNLEKFPLILIHQIGKL